MRKFEVGKRYNDGVYVFEVIKRGAKTLKVVQIQHAERFNEKKCDEKVVKIQEWDDREVFITNNFTVEA